MAAIEFWLGLKCVHLGPFALTDCVSLSERHSPKETDRGRLLLFPPWLEARAFRFWNLDLLVAVSPWSAGLQ